MSDTTAVRHQMVTATTEMLLISDPVLPAVQAELRYYCDDPFAVQMLLSIDQSPAICWVFGRELLADGLHMPAGIGDVQIYPVEDGVAIELRSGSSSAKLLAYGPDLQTFVDRTRDLVPAGAELEHDDIDGELALLPVHDNFSS
jgi:Streptomyces sporulation and cell division protein, SsgA